MLVMRDGKERKISVSIGRLPEDGALRTIPAKNSGPRKNKSLGIGFTTPSDKVRESLGLEKEGGALITEVRQGPGKRAGLRKGDVISMFDGQQVKDAAHLEELVENAEGKRSVAVLVTRQDGPIFIAMRLED